MSGALNQDDLPNASAVLERVLQHVQEHPQLKAAWLKGSHARGDADRHSDLDLHLWLEPQHFDVFVRALEAWLGELYPVVRFHLLFDGKMVSAIFQIAPKELFSLHLFLETDAEAPVLEPGHQRLLWDRNGVLGFKDSAEVPLETLRRELDVAVRYFWTLFLSLPTLERGERIAAVAYLSHLAGQLVLVCGMARGVSRRIGEGRNNALLSGQEQQAIEEALTLPDLSPPVLIRAHLRLAELMRQKGREAARFLDTDYPEALEGAVLAHVRRELTLQGHVLTSFNA